MAPLTILRLPKQFMPIPRSSPSSAPRAMPPAPTFSVKQIGELIAFCKKIKPDVICMVDNCYGEFVETIEPSDVGADMVVGSLIKNPGGGLAPIGGYICGTEACVSRCAYRLSAPGLGPGSRCQSGVDARSVPGLLPAPTVVAGAEKGAIFAANLYELWLQVCPRCLGNPPRYHSGSGTGKRTGHDCILQRYSGRGPRWTPMWIPCPGLCLAMMTM